MGPRSGYDALKGANITGSRVVSFMATGSSFFDSSYFNQLGGRLTFAVTDVTGDYNPLVLGARCAAEVDF